MAALNCSHASLIASHVSRVSAVRVMRAFWRASASELRAVANGGWLTLPLPTGHALALSTVRVDGAQVVVIAGADGSMERDYEFRTTVRLAELPDKWLNQPWLAPDDVLIKGDAAQAGDLFFFSIFFNLSG